MSIVIDGTGTISGVSATGLTTAQTVASAQLPAGSVLQVVQASYGVIVETTSATYVTSNLTASITPKFSTSKILAIVNFPASIKASTRQVTYTLYRNSTNLAPNTGGQLGYGQIYSDSGNLQALCCMNVYDSPATTSATTYTMYFASTNSGQVQVFNNYLSGNITLLEVAA
jgi:hypothetical protein